MEQLSLFEPDHWTVAELTRYLRTLFEEDEKLQDIWVLGEISNLSRPSSGHLYFTLKDATASLRCVMWRNAVNRLLVIPQEGSAVEVHGNLNIYEPNGQYQLYADGIRLAGEGILFQEFLRLKARLEAEGLFDPSRKHPIPILPKRIGIVTSPTGAALQDILNTLQHRYPLAEVYLSPSAVQGDEAPQQIIDAITRLNQTIKPDVILVARGGGSIEDLWAFNDEKVARAIYESRIPIITGIGHETDFTIADFVADLRAPTPTGAAVLATPDRDDLMISIKNLDNQMRSMIDSMLSTQKWRFTNIQNQLLRASPIRQIQNNQQKLDEIDYKLTKSLTHSYQILKSRLQGLDQHLQALNPSTLLAKGFALITHKPDGKLINSVGQVSPGNLIGVRVSDGEFEAIVKG